MRDKCVDHCSASNDRTLERTVPRSRFTEALFACQLVLTPHRGSCWVMPKCWTIGEEKYVISTGKRQKESTPSDRHCGQRMPQALRLEGALS